MAAKTNRRFWSYECTRLLRRLTKDLRSSKTGEIHVHGIFVQYTGMRPTPITEKSFLSAIDGNPAGSVSLKQYYEDISCGRLTFGGTTTESLEMDGETIDMNDACTAFLKQALAKQTSFPPRTHFMFAFDNPSSGAQGLIGGPVLRFDAAMRNTSTLVHEFGHNLGLMHAVTTHGDRDKEADESDRMGAANGFMEFNAPNRVYLGWLEPSSCQEVRTSGDYAVAPLEYSCRDSGLPKVVAVPISSDNCLYLSMRDKIGPYDSRYLGQKFVRRLSVHTLMMDKKHRKLRATCLHQVVGEGETYRFTHEDYLKVGSAKGFSCGAGIAISKVRHLDGVLHFHVSFK